MVSRIAIVPVVLFVGIAGFGLEWNGWVVGALGTLFGVADVAPDSFVARSRQRQVTEAFDAPRDSTR